MQSLLKFLLCLGCIITINACSRPDMLSEENWGRIVIKKDAAVKLPPSSDYPKGARTNLAYICNKNVPYAKGDYELIENSCSREYYGIQRIGHMGNLSTEEARLAMEMVHRIQNAEQPDFVSKNMSCMSQRAPSSTSPFILEVTPPNDEKNDTICYYRSHPSTEKLFEKLFTFMRKQCASRGGVLPLIDETPPLGTQKILFESLPEWKQKELGSPATLDKKETWNPLPEQKATKTPSSGNHAPIVVKGITGMSHE